jgi:hypothetical protein
MRHWRVNNFTVMDTVMDTAWTLSLLNLVGGWADR